MERLKDPEEYIELFLHVKKGRITAKDALWIEKKETAPRSGSGWYELHPFGVELGTWNEKEDALRAVDIDAWNAKAHGLVSKIRAGHRKNILFLCAIFGPALLIAGWLQNDLSFGASGVFFLVIAAMLWRQIAGAKQARPMPLKRPE
jgi:hypothetical protein